ncbi:MAG: hypothetical protein PHP45_08485 [Elusimicrobiales bacterium]|nr:hypothetical protein [Elusimicrobiales bacterium]
MRKSLLSLIAIPAFACAAAAQERQSLPPVEDVSLPPHGRIYRAVTAELSVPLHFSEKQKKRIESALYDDVDKPLEKIAVEYEARMERARRLRYELNDIRFAMFNQKAGLPAEIRKILSPGQVEKFDKMVYNGYLASSIGKTGDAYTQEIKEVVTTGPDGKPVRRRIIIRHRKKAAEPAETPADETKPSPLIEETPAGSYP